MKNPILITNIYSAGNRIHAVVILKMIYKSCVFVREDIQYSLAIFFNIVFYGRSDFSCCVFQLHILHDHVPYSVCWWVLQSANYYYVATSLFRPLKEQTRQRKHASIFLDKIDCIWEEFAGGVQIRFVSHILAPDFKASLK